LLFVLFVGINSAWAQITYVWNKTGSAAYGTAANWTPTRTTPATTDIHQFSIGGTITVTGVPSETIAGLSISNKTILSVSTFA
jgi:hypothetical protein